MKVLGIVGGPRKDGTITPQPSLLLAPMYLNAKREINKEEYYEKDRRDLLFRQP